MPASSCVAIKISFFMFDLISFNQTQLNSSFPLLTDWNSDRGWIRPMGSPEG